MWDLLRTVALFAVDGPLVVARATVRIGDWMWLDFMTLEGAAWDQRFRVLQHSKGEEEDDESTMHGFSCEEHAHAYRWCSTKRYPKTPRQLTTALTARKYAASGFSVYPNQRRETQAVIKIQHFNYLHSFATCAWIGQFCPGTVL